MAGVTLSKLYLHTASDFSDYLTLYVSDINPEREKDMTVGVYAGGVRRVVKKPGIRLRYSYTLPHLTAAERDSLDALVGEEVMVRDPVGSKFWAVIPSLGGPFFRALTESKASLTLEAHTASEAI